MIVSGEFASEGDTAVSIRHHDVVLGREPPAAAANAIAGTVLRQTYLGPNRDYLVQLPGGECARALAPIDVNVAVGSEVWLHFPPERCRALAR